MNDINLDLKEINKCVRCGTCRTVCPVFEESGWESANTRGRILLMKGLAKGLAADSEVLKSLNTCTTCGICRDNCPADVNFPRLIESARRNLVSSGFMTSEQAQLCGKIYESGNTFGDPRIRHTWLNDQSLLKDKADYVYFVGCMNSYRYQKTAARTFAILSRFKATLLPSEQCCGSPLLRTGFDAKRFIDDNSRQIRQIGAKTIITGCAGCYTTLKNSYSKDFRVLSVPEFLAEKISDLNLKPLDITVTYHDPCHLGRQSASHEPPRQVIRAICDLSEMKSSGKASRCCGAGGGVRAGYSDISLGLARRRLKDVPEDVDYIVTSCPLCIRNLRDAGAGEKVIDLVDLVAMSIG